MARNLDPALDLADRAEALLVDGFLAALQEANAQTARTLIELGRIMQQGLAAGETARANATIAQAAQKSILRSYDQTVGRRKRAAGQFPYRTGANKESNRRYAGGLLRRALASGEFWHADATTIEVINVGLLDKEARQWARLNAGAGQAGTGSRRTFEVSWSNLTVAALGLDMAPSASFTIPPGYWYDRGEGAPVAPGQPGSSEFYPLGEGPRASATRFVRAGRTRVPLQTARTTRGIRASNFLDAGMATIAREFPATYMRVYEDLWNKGVATVRPARANVHVTTRTRRNFGG